MGKRPGKRGVLTLLVIVALALVACGGNQGQPAAKPDASAGATTSPAAQQPEAQQPAPSPASKPQAKAEPAKPADKIKVGLTGVTASNWHYWVAQEKGMYKAQNLDVEFVIISGTAANVQALIGGDIQFFGGDLTQVIQAQVMGAELVMVAEAVHETPYLIISLKDINSMADLKGKRVGGAGGGSWAQLLFETALVNAGLDPTKDVEMLNMRGSQARLAGLQTGQIAATILITPQNVVAVKAGLKVLAYVGDAYGTWVGYGITTSRAFAGQKPDVVRRFVAGSLDALKYIKSNKAGAVEIGKKIFKEGDELVAQAWDDYTPHMRENGNWDDEGLKKAVEFYAKAGKATNPIDPNKLVDPQFLPKR